MSLQDPIADMLTRIRNGQTAGKKSISMPASTVKADICKVLHEEGYIGEFSASNDENSKPIINVELKYCEGKPVISKITRASKPGLRVYKKKDELPKVLSGLGISIISTPAGVMSDKQARQKGQGGEVLCYVE